MCVVNYKRVEATHNKTSPFEKGVEERDITNVRYEIFRITTLKSHN